MDGDVSSLDAVIGEEKKKFDRVRQEIGAIIVGQKQLVDRLLLALITDGHLLLEGVPGLAKTLAVTTLARAIDCNYQRVQFTPDLLPADLIGTSVYNPKEGTFSVRKGPIFTNILLGDEINRAPAKVQSALLEVMQERQVTIQGETFKTGSPYLVLATQNPIEHEGTYPLPEAQTDRFMMKVLISYPSQDEEKEILNRVAKIGVKAEVKPVLRAEEILQARKMVNEIYIDEKITKYILDIVFATRFPKEYQVPIDHLLQYGASPRASIGLSILAKGHAFLSGRSYVTPHDVKAIVHDVLRHRLRRTYEAEAEGVTPDAIIDMLLDAIAVP